jgi:hypothetical protein
MIVVRTISVLCPGGLRFRPRRGLGRAAWQGGRRPVSQAVVVTMILATILIIGGGVETRAADPTTITEEDCGILLPGILPDGQVLSTTGSLIITAGGTATLICQGQLDPALAPAEAVIITNVACALGDGGTVGESQTRVSPSGAVLLVGHNNPGSEPLPPPEGD